MNEPRTGGESKWHAFGKVQLYARRDAAGRPTKVDAISEDPEQVRALADRLQGAGYGVLRERVPRAGRVYYRLRALWAGPGDPAENPFEQS